MGGCRIGNWDWFMICFGSGCGLGGGGGVVGLIWSGASRWSLGRIR